MRTTDGENIGPGPIREEGRVVYITATTLGLMIALLPVALDVNILGWLLLAVPLGLPPHQLISFLSQLQVLTLRTPSDCGFPRSPPTSAAWTTWRGMDLLTRLPRWPCSLPSVAYTMLCV